MTDQPQWAINAAVSVLRDPIIEPDKDAWTYRSYLEAIATKILETIEMNRPIGVPYPPPVASREDFGDVIDDDEASDTPHAPQEARQTPQKVGDVTTDPGPQTAPYGQPQQHQRNPDQQPPAQQQMQNQVAQ